MCHVPLGQQRVSFHLDLGWHAVFCAKLCKSCSAFSGVCSIDAVRCKIFVEKRLVSQFFISSATYSSHVSLGPAARCDYQASSYLLSMKQIKRIVKISQLERTCTNPFQPFRSSSISKTIWQFHEKYFYRITAASKAATWLLRFEVVLASKRTTMISLPDQRVASIRNWRLQDSSSALNDIITYQGI